MKNFSWICEPRPISKCKVVLDVYFRPFSSILGMMFFQKMALCEYLILVIFGQFWLFRANFGPEISKEYLFQLFRCKKDNGITKSGLIWLFGKLGSPGAPKPTLGPKTPLNGPGRAKIGVNAPHAVQLTSFGPKKPDSNRTPQRSVPFTWNQTTIWYLIVSILSIHRLGIWKRLKMGQELASDQTNCSDLRWQISQFVWGGFFTNLNFTSSL